MSKAFNTMPARSRSHHPASVPKSSVAITCLASFGSAGLSVWLPLSISLWVLAARWSEWLYLEWQWTTFWIAANHRLAARRAVPVAERDLGTVDARSR